MNRTPLKRTSTLRRGSSLARRTFRHDDEAARREEHKEIKAALPLGGILSGITIMANMTDPQPCERDVTVTILDGARFVTEPPVWNDRKLTKRQRKRRNKKTRYASRERHFDYMGFVKGLPCLMASYGGCSGVIEADHAGLDRGVGQKAHDNTCIPLCSQHHLERHNFSGVFKLYNQETMRTWRTTAIELTQQAARRAGVEVPT